jgi:hypothetical protein
MVAFLLAVTPAGPENAVDLFALGAVQLLRHPTLPASPTSEVGDNGGTPGAGDGVAPPAAGRQLGSVR